MVVREVRKHTSTYSKKALKAKADIESFNDMLENLDTIDASANGPDADADYGASVEGKVAKAEIYAGATTGRADAQFSIFGAFAEGPSAFAGAEAKLDARTLPVAKASVGAEASLFKAGVNVGPVVAQINPNLNTGASIGSAGVSANFLGFGFSLGLSTKISTPLGSIGLSL